MLKQKPMANGGKQGDKFLGLQILIVLIGFGLSFGAWHFARQSVRHHAEDSFFRQDSELVSDIKERIRRDIYLLYGLKGLFAASDSVEREEFYTYVEGVNLFNNYPGITAVAFWQFVPLGEEEIFVADFKSDNSVKPDAYPDLKLYPAVEKNQANVVVKYIYPEAENSAVLGFVASGDPIRQEALLKATDNGLPYVTAKVNLLPDNVPGFIFLAPVYKNKAPLETLADRRQNLLGFVAVTIRADKFFNGIFANKEINWRKFGLAVFDGAPTDLDQAFNYFDSSLQLGGLSRSTGLQDTQPFAVAERIWTLQFWADDNYDLTRLETIIPWLFLFIGLILTVVVMVFAYITSREKARALTLAEQISKELKESQEKMGAVIMAAKDAIVIMDEKARVVLWSKGAQDMFGYKEAEILGKEFHSLIAVDKVHQTKKDNLLNFGQTGLSEVLGKSLELKVKNKAKKVFMVELTVSAVKIKDRWHAVGIMRDITNRKDLEVKAKEYTDSLEEINKLMVDRELKMIELKKKIIELEKKQATK